MTLHPVVLCDHYERVMNVNVRAYLLYARHAYPHLARRCGCMIHIASDAGIWGAGNRPVLGDQGRRHHAVGFPS